MSHIIFFFGKFLDLLISIHDHGKCWCLYSSNFQILVIQNGKKLYDLTTLQREANRMFGYTAQQTLDAVQEMYEQKLVTYPRTDSRSI